MIESKGINMNKGEKKMEAINPSAVVFVLGFIMCLVGGYAWLTKDTQASVRNAEMTKDILTKVEVAIKKSDEVSDKLAQASVDFATEIGKTNQNLKAVAESSKNISVNLPHSVQFNVVYKGKTQAMETPITLPPIPKNLIKKPTAVRSRANN